MGRLFLALSFAFFLAVSCSGCEPDCECAPGQDCIDGVCVNVGECPGGCGDAEVCLDGRCVSNAPQCSAVGQICDIRIGVDDDFFCLTLVAGFEGECVRRCSAQLTCDVGSVCFFLASAADAACTSDSECVGTQSCQQGACRDTVCRPSECDGLLSGQAQCDELYGEDPAYALGTRCEPVGNGARYCYPAGPRTENEACGDLLDALDFNNFDNICQPGLACIDGICQPVCSSSDDCVDRDCLLAEEGLVDDGVGFCGDACTPFEVGDCGPARTCFPLTTEQGICIAAGNTAAYESCTPGAGDCADGTACVTFQQADPGAGTPAAARCQPLCNIAAGPAAEDGRVGEFAQSLRDATCPQPDVVSSAWISVVNLAQATGDVDVYFQDEMTPLVSGLAYGSRLDQGMNGIAVDPGTSMLRVLPAGAPRTDPPLASLNVTVEADVLTRVVLTALPLLNDALAPRAQPADPARPEVASIQFVHAIHDAQGLGLRVIAEDESQQELLIMEEGHSDWVEVSGDFDVYVFDGPADGREITEALFTGSFTFSGENTLLYVAGTLEPDDASPVDVVEFATLEVPSVMAGGLRSTCVDLNNGIYGYCQQNCGNDPAVLNASVCDGDGMGCLPTFQPGTARYQTLCSPMGTRTEDQSCNPFANWTGCGQGLYCQEYGNLVASYDPALRGRCRPLCDLQNSQCSPQDFCKPIDYQRVDYRFGECASPCDPMSDYSDPSCPDGLGQCLPVSSLQDDLDGQGMTAPDVRQEQPFCSASGDIVAGEACFGADCEPGTECLFPRSRQGDFTSTVLSQYFGGAGLAPTCQPICDPFTQQTGVMCAADETCLFNFPISSRVGHCAPIVEEVAPLLPCTRPGESCGVDSICVLNGGTPTCFRFCEYTGGSADAFDRSTCPMGLECAPLANDVGVCLGR